MTEQQLFYLFVGFGWLWALIAIGLVCLVFWLLSALAWLAVDALDRRFPDPAEPVIKRQAESMTQFQSATLEQPDL